MKLFENELFEPEMVVVCVNGAPQSGKDTFASQLKNNLSSTKNSSIYDVIIDKFAKPLDDIAQVTLGMYGDEYKLYREEKKDDPLPNRGDVTLRQVLIAISEDYCKPLFGETYFADQAYNRIQKVNSTTDVIIFSDSGFQSEYDKLKLELSKYENVSLKLVRMMKKGCTYENDSREYVYDDKYTIINNNGSIDKLNKIVVQYISDTLFKSK